MCPHLTDLQGWKIEGTEHYPEDAEGHQLALAAALKAGFGAALVNEVADLTGSVCENLPTTPLVTI